MSSQAHMCQGQCSRLVRGEEEGKQSQLTEAFKIKRVRVLHSHLISLQLYHHQGCGTDGGPDASSKGKDTEPKIYPHFYCAKVFLYSYVET